MAARRERRKTMRATRARRPSAKPWAQKQAPEVEQQSSVASELAAVRVGSESTPACVDMATFPLIRLDHLPLLPTAELQRAASELSPLIESLRAEHGDGNPLLKYAVREADAVRRQLGLREAAERVRRLLSGEDAVAVHRSESVWLCSSAESGVRATPSECAPLDCGASVASEPSAAAAAAPPSSLLPMAASAELLPRARPASSERRAAADGGPLGAARASSASSGEQRRSAAPEEGGGLPLAPVRKPPRRPRPAAAASKVVRTTLDASWGSTFMVSGNRKGSRKASRAAERERIAASAAAKVDKRKRREKEERRAAKRAARQELRERERQRVKWEEERAGRAAKALEMQAEARERQRLRCV